MNRRELLSTGLSTAALLASPSVLRAREGNTLKFVPIADLAIVDPIVTSSLSTRCHAYLVFDTLYGLDKNYHGRARRFRQVLQRGQELRRLHQTRTSPLKKRKLLAQTTRPSIFWHGWLCERNRS
ncbi:MAG: hypothetical protein JO137_13695 [Hyphomicrobiales bacterium]|nr:hypothetical protein [Hyphomicrobiales bacterium]MBV9432867.1 hypothetical protein [Hyphomicrobiales bacterium]